MYANEPGAVSNLSVLLEEALPALRAAGNDAALYIGYVALTSIADMRGQMRAMLDAFEQAAFHASLTGRRAEELLGPRAYGRCVGPTRASELLEWLDEHEEAPRPDYFLRAFRAQALAMLARFDEARAILADARAVLSERGSSLLLANITAIESVLVERWAGDLAAAAAYGAEGLRMHESLGEHGYLSKVAGHLGQCLLAPERLDEAGALADRAAEAAGEDVADQMLWRQVRAKVLARRGDHAEAERLAREAVAIGDGTDLLNSRAEAHADLAEVLTQADRPRDAVDALGDALALFEEKENLAMAGQVRDRLAALLE
jgi:tetratricopeptide (TPR) repeat protein